MMKPRVNTCKIFNLMNSALQVLKVNAVQNAYLCELLQNKGLKSLPNLNALPYDETGSVK